ncbi:MAG: FAD-dependent oxidoreductase [Cyanobacteriota bacterium]
MTTYDWIVVGGGVAGSALAYELVKLGSSVLLLEQSAAPANGTRYSYGGIAYWSGNTPLTQQLFQEGIAIHRQLSDELEGDTQFRELDLVLVIEPGEDVEAIAQSYHSCWIPPQPISVEFACELEPLMNPAALGGALHTTHGHVSPEATTLAYQQAFQRLGGEMRLAQATGFVREGDRTTGITTPEGTLSAAGVIVSAGGWTRALLRQAGLSARIYFSQAELIETPPDTPTQMHTLVMPAVLKRFEQEAAAGAADALWDQPGQEVVPPILDEGVIQFKDGRIRIGQVTRMISSLEPAVDAAASEASLRQAVGRFLPSLKDVPGTWSRCPVAFSGDRLPLIGPVPNAEGIHLFSGFSNPFAIMPPLARRYARHLVEQADPLLEGLSPGRFGV